MMQVNISKDARVAEWPCAEFSRWLRSARKACRVSQRSLAEQVGVSRAYISRLEGSKCTEVPQPKGSVVRSIAKRLRVPEGLALEKAGYGTGSGRGQFHPDEVRYALLRDPKIGPDVIGVVFQLYLLLRRRPAS